MKKARQTILWFTFIFSVFLRAQGIDNSGKSEKHCLWQLSSGVSTLYFLGSIHVLSETDYPLDSCIEEAYKNSKIIYFEIDMDSAAMPLVQYKIMTAGMLKNHMLNDVISDTTYQMLRYELDKYDIPIVSLNLFKPWMVATMLTMARLNALGIGEQYGIDNTLFRKSKADNKVTAGMESIDHQILCFNALDNDLQEELLLETIQSLDEIENEFIVLKEAWKHGEEAVIDSVMNKYINVYPDLKKVLLDDRNQRWMLGVEQMIKNHEKAMIVVGVGHLVGKGSLIDMCRKRGYAVEQL